ncbi:Hypothetical predicted protein, partial [Pelobates cultripes]
MAAGGIDTKKKLIKNERQTWPQANPQAPATEYGEQTEHQAGNTRRPLRHHPRKGQRPHWDSRTQKWSIGSPATSE